MSTDARSTTALSPRARWFVLAVICLGVLMVMLDTTVVSVALPAIGRDLQFTDTSLVWTVNAYVLAFGGCLLLGGRLGDLYGHRRLFLSCVFLFTGASIACGLATSQSLFIAARAVQGVNAAAVLAVTLSLIVSMFADGPERAKAMGVYSFVCAAGGSAGLLFGGALASLLGWRWIFLVNIPIGLVVCVFAAWLPPDVRAQGTRRRLDMWGAVTVTVSLVLAVYAIVHAGESGWVSARTLGLLAAATLLLILFLFIEARELDPLVPLAIFRCHNLMISNTVRILWAAGTSGAYFCCVLYLQRVLGYDAMQVALAFLPANVITALFALGLSTRVVKYLGYRAPIGAGLLLGAVGLALFARVPVDGEIVRHILPSMILLGVGGGIAFTPMLLTAMQNVPASETGLASGLANTASVMGSALGLAILAALSASRTTEMLVSGAGPVVALIGGYRVAFILGAVCAATAALVAVFFLRTQSHI